MLPAIAPGDRLLVLSWWRIRPGAVVALADPRRPGGLAGEGRTALTLVKRVSEVQGDVVWVQGDNGAESTDSRHWGPVPRGAIDGVAVYRYAPASRAGRLRPP